MRRWARAADFLAAIAVVAMAVGCGSSEHEGARLLRDSYQAERKYSYLGVLEVELLRRTKPIRASLNVMHAAPNKTRTDVAAPESVEGYVIIHNADTRYIYSPNSKRWYGNTLRPPDEDVELALKNYRVRVAGRDRVIGRPCWRLKITPRHAGSPSKMIWVDRQTRLVLRKELRNADGEVISRSRYQKITVKKAGSLAGESFLPPEHAEVNWDTKSAPHKFTELRPAYVPPGYRFDEIRVRVYRGHERAHLRYTDGLNSISVFEEIASERPARVSKKDDRKPSVGGNMLYWNVIERQVGDLRIVVMGDIAAGELQKMIESISPPAKPGPSSSSS